MGLYLFGVYFLAGADIQTLLEDQDSQVWVWPDASETQADPATPAIEAFAAYESASPAEQAEPEIEASLACVAPHPEPVEAFPDQGEPVHPPKKQKVQEDVVKWVEGIPFVQHHKDGDVYVGRVKLSIEGTIEKKIVKCHDGLCTAAAMEYRQMYCTCFCHILQNHYTQRAVEADCRARVPASWATQSS